MEKTKDLTKLRQAQQRKLMEHDRMHRAAENEKMATAARAVQIANAQREALQRTKMETKAEAEAVAAERFKQAEEKHHEQSRMLEERLTAAAQRRLDDMIEQKRRETVRADKLQQERDAARAEAKEAHRYAERVLKDKEEALRAASTQALREKNAAIQMERDKAETARRTAAQAEAVRAAQVNTRAKDADDITALATQALKVAQEEKRRSEENWKLAEAQRLRHTTAVEEAEYVREEAKLELERAKRFRHEAEDRVQKMQEAMEVQRAALQAVEKNASAEKLALLKAAEEAKLAALAQAGQEREREHALIAAQKEKAKATALLAKKLGLDSDAETAPEDTPTVPKPPPEQATLQSADPTDDSGAHSASPAEERARYKEAGQIWDSSGDTTKIQVLAEQLQLMTTKAEQESSLAAAAEERVSRLEETLAQIHAEKASAADERRMEIHAAKKELLDDIATLETKLAQAGADKRMALVRLREAYAARVTVAPMTSADADRAMSVAASAVRPDAIAPVEDQLVGMANIGVVVASRLSSMAVSIAGFDATSGEPEVVSVAVSGGENPFDAGSCKCDGSGVVVKLREDEWLLKWVVDLPRDDADVDDTAFGKQHVTIATAKEGIVVAQGTVDVQPRPESVPESGRYDFGASMKATQKLQARIRGRSARNEMVKRAEKGKAAARITAAARGREVRKQNQLARQGRAATKLQAIQRGKNGRNTTQQAQMEARGWGGVYVIATRKPLICRATSELKSDRVAEAAPDARVVVCDTHILAEGVTRALVRFEDAPPSKPLGWLTASKDGAKSLWPAPPKPPELVD